jgi:hypothetical protein
MGYPWKMCGCNAGIAEKQNPAAMKLQGFERM